MHQKRRHFQRRLSDSGTRCSIPDTLPASSRLGATGGEHGEAAV
jgi:hypothetical protein